MKVIALCQAYNEDWFIHQSLSWAKNVCDQIILTEGSLTPFGNMSARSTDRTRDTIDRFIKSYDRQGKIQFYDAHVADPAPRDREGYEGVNKNFMLKKSGVEPGDLIFILDVDEFWHEENFMNIVERFRKNDKIDHIPVEEYQFAYNLRYCFAAEHNGRFFRYKKGAKFGSTNHFVYDTGVDITKDYTYLAKREDTQMCHLCWCKHPKMIRQKVVSFNRPSFTQWYNAIYLGYPIHGEEVYKINQTIPPYFGRGYAEGQHEPLRKFEGILPRPIANMGWDQGNYIRKHHDELVI